MVVDREPRRRDVRLADDQRAVVGREEPGLPAERSSTGSGTPS